MGEAPRVKKFGSDKSGFSSVGQNGETEFNKLSFFDGIIHQMAARLESKLSLFLKSHF